MSSTPDFLSFLGDDSSSQQPTNVSQTPPSPDTPTNPVQSTPDGQSAAPAAQPQRPSLWRNVLAGALAGLANSAGAKNFASGAASGVAGAINQQQQQAAAQRQAQQDQQNIKFANANEAYRAAQLSNQDQELHNRTQEAQDAHDKNVQQIVDIICFVPLRMPDNRTRCRQYSEPRHNPRSH